MHKGQACPDGLAGFPNGTTNGALWYPLVGELIKMQILSPFSITCFDKL